MTRRVDRLTRLVFLAAIALLASACGGGKSSMTHTRTYTMPSSSMEPTLHCARPGFGCRASKADGLVTKPVKAVRRGDIVVFNTPRVVPQLCGAGGKFVKRAIGLPGETWEERNGYVYINGTKLNEPYIHADRRDNMTKPPQKIPTDAYFVMGDNRRQSCDSRVWGTVPKRNIVGRVVKIVRGR